MSFYNSALKDSNPFVFVVSSQQPSPGTATDVPTALIAETGVAVDRA
jgi:hypothetical protein